MTVVSAQTTRFTSTSPVTRYWLANCAGFSVAGGGCGTVVRVGDGHLEVRHRRKTRRVPLTAVVEILPAERRLIVRGSDRVAARRAALGHMLGHAAGTAGVLLLGLAAWLVRSGKMTVRLVRSLPWQQYGRSVRSVMTKLWQALSPHLSRLLTTSSARITGKSSARRARTTSST